VMGVHIYVLRHPVTGEPRYVGQSNNPDARLVDHIGQARSGASTHKCHWLRSLLSQGLEPWLEVIDTLPDRHTANLAEEAYISAYREAIGWSRVTNMSDGGYTPPTEANIEALRTRMTGEGNPMKRPEVAAKVSAKMRGKVSWGEGLSKHTSESYASVSRKMSGSGNPNFGKSPSEDTRAKRSAAMVGKRLGTKHPMFGVKHSPEARLKMRVGHSKRRLITALEAWEASNV